MKHHKHTTALPLLLLATIVTGCAGLPGQDIPAHYQTEIRRTSYGIPHIKAGDWASLGYGYGYVQAQDNLCTLADAFVTFRGRRSYFFGPDAKLSAESTLGRPKNIDADFFFRLIAPDEEVQTYKTHQPREIQDLVKGFAAGYSRYVRQIKSGEAQLAHQACRTEPWVDEITEADGYRRMIAANIAGGYARFVRHIANAYPPEPISDGADTGLAPSSMNMLAQHVSQTHFQVGGQEGIGSNMIGFGGRTTGTDHGLLFGNPHWYWRGQDRFYQAHLTIPGKLDASGASFLGLPLIVIGYNDHIAWSHTVSTARRFGLFELSLLPGKPTSYLYDGQVREMTQLPIIIEARSRDGKIEKITRTLYRSHLGPMVDLTAFSPQLRWNGSKAFAIRDVNADNFRIFKTYLRWGQARTLDEFIHIQKDEAAVPWLNTVAVGRRDQRVWYADIGAVPNVPDALVAACTTSEHAKVFAQAAPGIPFLDGSKSSCDWMRDPDAVQPGAMAPSRMPSLIREDYVANMNDSHWLSNPTQPLTGYPRIVGRERTTQSLRTRLGHLLVQRRLAGIDGHAGNKASSGAIRDLVLDSRVHSAELFKTQLLDSVCTHEKITVARDPLMGEVFAPAREIDITKACAVLRQWDNTGNTGARGAHIWDEFWTRASLAPRAELFSTPFSADDPLNTPRNLKTGNALLSEAFAVAVLRIQQSGFALDAARNEYLFVNRNGTRIPLFGGCEDMGYFTIACSKNRIEQGGYSMDGDATGNSYMQVVTFSNDGVEPYTLLTFSQSDDPASRHFADYTRRYAGKQWLRVPFKESEIAADPEFISFSLRQ